jgi:[ribosomal protein S5]-alanine N-acetyltransferase
MTTAMPILETERLVIRPFTMDDLNDIHQVYVEANWIDSNNTPEQELEARRKWLEWQVINYDALANLYQPPYGDRAVVLKELGVMVGSVGLVQSFGPFGLLPHYKSLGGEYLTGDEMRHFPEMGLFWAFKREHQGQGYATEAARALIDYAFTNLHLRRIVATTSYDNAASMAVMRRLGMKVEHNPQQEPPYFQVTGILEHNWNTQIEYATKKQLA